MSTIHSAPELIGMMELAKLLGMSHWTLRKVVKAIGIGVRIGDRIVIRREELPTLEAELKRRANWRERKAKAVAAT